MNSRRSTQVLFYPGNNTGRSSTRVMDDVLKNNPNLVINVVAEDNIAAKYCFEDNVV